MESVKKIAVLTNCRLGDSLVMIPALRLLRKKYPNASLTIISEAAGSGLVAAKDILGNRGLVDDFIEMRFPANFFLRALERIKFVWNLRKLNFDLGIVLFPPVIPLTMPMVKRLSRYLRLGNVRRVVAPENILSSAECYPKAADAIISVLKPLGIGCPEGEGDYLLNPAKGITEDGAALRLAVAAGANFQSKTWPKERFASVLTELKREFPHLLPVYFGGENERVLCQWLNEKLPGELVVGRSLTDVEDCLRKCRLYLGNDTGLMHFAAAVGLKCVVPFSAHNLPGVWEPYGDGHRMLKAPHLACESCMQKICPIPEHPCMNNITVEQVLEATRSALSK